MRIDLRAGRAWLGGTDIHLTRFEYRILKYLAQRVGQVVTYQDLWRAVWETECALNKDERAAVRQQMTRLRGKLGEDWENPRFIMCVWGTGFYLEVRLTEIIR